MNLKIVYLICSVLFVIGCGSAKTKDMPLVIDNISISRADFDKAFKRSQYWDDNKDPDNKQKFLRTFISKKLILREAEKLGLDKNESFLEDIQVFWEQSLLKRVLTKKTEKLINNVSVTDEESKAFFTRHKETQFKDKTFEDIKPQIVQWLIKEKQQYVLNKWITSLEEKIEIKINRSELGLDPEK